MISAFKNAFKVETLRKKILFTIFMIAIIRMGYNIPVPGVNADAIGQFLKSFGESAGFLDMVTGGGLGKMALFGLGILPYINASIVMQLLTVAIPALEKVSKEEDGRQKINKITKYGAIVLSAIQSFGIIYGFRNAQILIDQTLMSYLVAIVTMTAGTAVLIWIGDKITEKGLGNGISMIIFLNIVSRFPKTFSDLSKTLNNTFVYLIILAVFLLIIGFVVIIQLGERRIPVEYAKRVSGRRVAGGGTSNIPIRVNLSGVMPVIFASSLLQLPNAIMQFMKAAGKMPSESFTNIVTWLSIKHPFGAVLYLVLILFFAYFYTTIQFNPIQFADNLKKSGGVIAGVRPGEPTVRYMSRVLNYVTLVGAIGLSLIAIAPVLLEFFVHTSVAFGGTSLLIAVGVSLEIVKQIEAHLLVRHYKGFLA